MRSGLRQVIVLLASVVLAAGAAGAGEVREELTREVPTDPSEAAALANRDGGEVFQLRWRFSGFLGALASLFVPSRGDAALTFVPGPEDRVNVQLVATAPKREGEYFVYGAEVDRISGATRAVWSSYQFRDKKQGREQSLEGSDVIDFASAIYRLRWNPPEKAVSMRIWHHGKTYPARIEPLGEEKRRIDGRKIQVRGYAVRGVKVKGEPFFEDRFFVYFAQDEHSMPVEILGKRGWVKIRFQLVEPEPSQRAAS